MAQIETVVQIAATPELIFAFFVPQRFPYWYGAEMEACIEVQGGVSDFAVSQKVRVTGHVGRREVSHTAVVTAFQQARLFEWRFEDRYGVKGRERWELEQANTPSAAGAPRTVVRMRSEYALPGLLGKAMDWLVTRHAVVRRNHDYLVRLKRLAEHGEPE
jgi:hypothetical protein